MLAGEGILFRLCARLPAMACSAARTLASRALTSLCRIAPIREPDQHTISSW